MVVDFIAALERPVSRVRLESYRPHQGSDLDMVVNYFYNLELAEALYPSLHAFEVAFRNSLHLTFTHQFRNPYWFDLPGLFPPPRPPATAPWQVKSVRDARATLTKANKPHDADRIVAELNFGFWHSLLNRPFEARFWRPNRARTLRQVFPGAPRRSFNRQIAWDRVDRIRIIRNRVMHYEPIWYRPHLRTDHADILEALRWISEDMHESIAMFDRFPMVIAGREMTEARIQQEIQRRSQEM